MRARSLLVTLMTTVGLAVAPALPARAASTRTDAYLADIR